MRAAASVVEIADASDAPAEIARYLREYNLPATLRIGADPRLADLPWLSLAAALIVASLVALSLALAPDSPGYAPAALDAPAHGSR